MRFDEGNVFLSVANETQVAKLTKLLSLWESKANFFDACVISKLKSPQSSLQEYRTNLLVKHPNVVSSVNLASKNAFDNYQQQHHAFVAHATQQIATLETQKQNLEQQNMRQMMMNNPEPQQYYSDNSNDFPSSRAQPVQNVVPPVGPNMSQGVPQQCPSVIPPNIFGVQKPLDDNIDEPQIADQSGFPIPPPNFQIPDLSKPPPNLNAPPQKVVEKVEDLTPSVPYFDLPAGLIVPLIRLEDYSYKPLDQSLIQLPQPTPPSERLLGAVEAFYSLPSHDRPRDG